VVKRNLALSLVAVVALVVCAASFGDPPSPDNPAGRGNDILGVVPVQSEAGRGGGGNGGSNLSYHGGPVMHTNSTYAIYWVPSGYSVSAGYESLLDQFLIDVGVDSGKTSNVYYSDTQYSDGATGSILYSSSFEQGIVDTNPFPASGCSDPYTSVCLTDGQLQTEISNVIGAYGLPRGGGTMYFMFTPRDVGSCFGSSCAFSYFCAYHSHFGSGSSLTLYANQPYAAWVPAACGPGQSPNADDADATINVTSHEHNEAITDPLGNAWYDKRGAEDGDKCAWTFGTSLGSTSGGRYNQLINGHAYFLQQEWSNRTSRCVLTGL